MDRSEVPAYVNGPGQVPAQPSSGGQPETDTAKKLLVAWIPYIREWREVFECEHGRYFCLDPGDGLPTHIKHGDGIEVIETTEDKCDEAMDAWCHSQPIETQEPSDSVGIDLPGVGLVRPEVSPVRSRSGRESAAGEVSLPDLPGGVVVQMHGLCRKCSGAATRNADGTWMHDGGRLCVDGFPFAEPVGVFADPIGVTLDSNLNEKEAVADEESPEAGDGIRPRGILQLIEDLGALVRKAHPNSALAGLEITAAAFGALLDIYAAPNAENEQGMCDDMNALRKHFAAIIAEGGAQ